MDLREIRVYVLSPGIGKYKARLKTTMERLQSAGFHNVEHVESVSDENPTNSLSRTNLLVFEKEKNKTGPFLIVEDDIQIEDNANFILHPPPDAVAVYLGVSMWVYPYEYHTLSCGKNIRTIQKQDTLSYNDDLVRVYGMTSAHAILYMDRTFTDTLALCIQSHLILRTAHDLVLATLQKYYNMYSLKKPIFYQDINEGGQQVATRLSWINNQYFHLV